MGEIFLSYASSDAALADVVAEGLLRAGHRVFLDSDCADGVAPGMRWQPTLFSELRQCDAVVFLNSSASQASMWCHTELAVAAELGKRVYPVDLAPGLAPHPLLRPLQGIRFEMTIGASVQRLAGQLGLDGLAQGTCFRWERGRAPYRGWRRWMWPTPASSSAGRMRSGVWSPKWTDPSVPAGTWSW